MRKTNGVFSQAERKAFMWALIVVAMMVALVTAYDWVAGPSLGIYSQDMRGASMPGVLDAQPLS